MVLTINNLISFFESYLPLSEEEKSELLALVTEKEFKRKQFLLQKNDICRHYNFIVSGLFKMYAIDKNGTEHILQFGIENEWILDLESFHRNRPTVLDIEAMEPSIVLQIERKDILSLFKNYPKFDRTFRVIIEDRYMQLEHRVLENISFTAEERYQNFIASNPSLSNRIPNTQIAAYLGITPEFLSKIRNNISRKSTGNLI